MIYSLLAGWYPHHKPVQPIILMFLSLTTGLISETALAADEEVPLEYSWYRVEVILFERPAVREENTQETLLRHEPRKFPTSLMTFVTNDVDLSRIYQLTPAARIGLTYPTLDINQHNNTPESPTQTSEEESLGDSPDTETSIDESSLPRDPKQILREAVHQWEASELKKSFTLLPVSQGDLNAAANRLQGSASYQLVDHLLWSQPVPERGEPVKVLLQLGERQRDMWRYEGYLAITLGRYLHVDTTLWYNPFDEDRPWHFPVSALGEVDKIRQSSEKSDPGYMQLSETRRMRSKTPHYLDHPKFGLLIQIDPIEPPDELVEQWKTLEESLQQ